MTDADRGCQLGVVSWVLWRCFGFGFGLGFRSGFRLGLGFGFKCQMTDVRCQIGVVSWGLPWPWLWLWLSLWPSPSQNPPMANGQRPTARSGLRYIYTQKKTAPGEAVSKCIDLWELPRKGRHQHTVVILLQGVAEVLCRGTVLQRNHPVCGSFIL